LLQQIFIKEEKDIKLKNKNIYMNKQGQSKDFLSQSAERDYPSTLFKLRRTGNRAGFKTAKLVGLCVCVFLCFYVFMFCANSVSAAKLYLSPSSAEYHNGCSVKVDIMVDTEGVDTSAADAVLTYDPAQIEVTALNSGNAYQTYLGHSYTGGTITLTGFNIMSATSGVARFGSFNFFGKPGITAAAINFNFTPGATTDSNVADMGSNDILSSVGTGNYTFSVGPCFPDNQAPRVVSTNPSQGATGIPLNSNVSFRITDNQSGVDLNSLAITIEGISYTKEGDNTFSSSGDLLDYTITIDPAIDFVDGEQVDVRIEARDLDGNIMSPYNFYFNRPEVDRNAPFVTDMFPANNQLNVPLDTNISFNIQDITPGVDISTVRLSIDGAAYDSSEFTYTGDASNYRVVVDPSADLPADRRIHLQVVGRDFNGNVMSPYNSYFNQAPEATCEELGCCECGAECPPCEPGAGTEEEGEEEPSEPLIQIEYVDRLVDNVVTRVVETEIYQTTKETVEVVTVQTIDNPVVEYVNKEVRTPVLTAATAASVASVATLGATTGINALAFLQYLFTQPFFLFLSRRRKGGRVYNLITNKPIALAVVRVYNADTRKLVTSRVTDRKGRYEFSLAPGRYFIKVDKKNFAYPSGFLQTKIYQEYEKSYHGQEFEVTDKSKSVNFAIALVPTEQAGNNSKVLRKFVWLKIQSALTLLGPILAIASFIIEPRWWVALLVVMHFMIYILFKEFAIGKKSKKNGVIINSKTNEPVNKAIVRVFDIEFNKLLDTRITDKKGRYSFLVGNKKYYITVEKPGYYKKRTQIFDLSSAKEPVLAVNLKLQKHNLGKKIIDAQEQGKSVTIRTQLGRQQEREVSGIKKIIRRSAEKFRKDLKDVDMDEMHEDYYDVDAI